VPRSCRAWVLAAALLTLLAPPAFPAQEGARAAAETVEAEESFGPPADPFGLGTTYQPPQNPVSDNEMLLLYESASGRSKEVSLEHLRMMDNASAMIAGETMKMTQSDEMASLFGDKDVREYARKFIARHHQETRGGMSLNGNPVMFMFISSSMPVSTLKTYAESMKSIPNTVVFVLRGFVRGVKRIQPTLDFIQSWVGWEPNDTPTFGVMIDPMLFAKYKVRQVPALVFDPAAVPQDYSGLADGKNPMEHPDGRPMSPLHDPVPEESYFSISGDVALDYHIEAINREAKSRYLEYLLGRLRSGGFHDRSRTEGNK